MWHRSSTDDARTTQPWAAWVGPTRQVSENSGSVDPVTGWATFTTATLQCDPHFDTFASMGTIHIYDEAIIPGGQYRVETIRQDCTQTNAANYSPPLAVTTSTFGDVGGFFDPTSQTWSAPDGVVGVPTDVVALVDKFANLPGAPSKSRADLYPATPDQVISIIDIVQAVDAFRGNAYPNIPIVPPCL